MSSSTKPSIFRTEALMRYGDNQTPSVAPRFIQSQRRRVPVIQQLNTTECGAACLAMILSYFGRPTRVTECRECLSSGRDGISAQRIVQTARSFGLRTKAYSVQNLADFQHIQLPAIAHWEFNHFVVIEAWRPEQIELVDPALGRRTVSAAEFATAFTGIVLTFEPGVHFNTRSQSPALPWRTYWQQVLATPGLLTQIVFVSLILQGVGLVSPFLTQYLVDRIIPAAAITPLTIWGAGIALIVVMHGFTSYIRSLLLIRLQNQLDARLMLNFFEHLLSLPFKFFQVRNSGDLLMRLSSNANIRELVTTQFLSTILDGGLVLLYFVLLLTQAPWFALLALGIGLLQVAILLSTTAWVHQLTQRTIAAQADAQSYLVEALSGISTVKAMGAEDRVQDHWTTLFYNVLNMTMRSNRAAAFIGTLTGTLALATPLLLLWLGAYSVMDGAITLGRMLALQAITIAFLHPLASLVESARQLQLVRAQLERLADVLEEAPEQSLVEGRHTPPLTGRISLDNVSFRYTPDAPFVVNHVSVTVQPGQTVAIVGRTGSGKSTLAKLLLGLYTPTDGALYFDDRPLEQLNYRQLRTQVGVVLQEPFLFSGSIRSNIMLNAPELPLERVVEAAQVAAIHADIQQMPMGYETRIAEGGSGLSGGQRQRITLARAIAHKPAILLLDEATSQLDTITEETIQQNLRQLACTQIIIAHRLSTIRRADLILVMHDGAIVEQGTHAELVANQGFYAQLVQNQAT